MNRHWLRSAGTLLLAAWCAPGDAQAEDSNWCIDPDGGSLPQCCDGANNGAPFTTFSEALAAAASAPEAPFDVASFCIASDGPEVMDIILDAEGALPAADNRIAFGSNASPNWCPGAGGIQLLNPSNAQVAFSLGAVHYDAASCTGSVPTPLIDVVGGTSEAFDIRVVGLEGALIEVTAPSGQETFFDFRTSRVEGGDGPVLSGGGDIGLNQVEISARTSSEPLISNGQAMGFLTGNGLLLYGNAVTGGRSLVESESITRLEQVHFVANEVQDGGAMVFVDTPNGRDNNALLIQGSTFSDNRVRSSGPLAAAPVTRPIGDASTQLEDLCLPTGSDRLRPSARTRPAVPGTPGPGALVRIGDMPGVWGLVRLEKNYFVESSIGAGGAIVALSGSTGRHILFLHNTVVESSAATIRAESDVAGSWLVSARNLLLGSPRLELGANWSNLETTMELLEGDPSGWLSGIGTATGVVGPFPPAAIDGGGALFLGDDATDLDDCQRVLAHCPNYSAATCTDGSLLQGVVQCGLDGAAAYLPSATGLSTAAYEWPWTNTAFVQRADSAPWCPRSPRTMGSLARSATRPPATTAPAATTTTTPGPTTTTPGPTTTTPGPTMTTWAMWSPWDASVGGVGWRCR